MPLKLPTIEVFDNYSDYLKIFSESGEYIIDSNLLLVASVTIGSDNQPFKLVLDTGSYIFWVAHNKSTDSVKINHKYNPSTSTTSTKTAEKFEMVYGTGSCSGYYYKDNIIYINNSPFPMKFGAATITNFDVTGADGIIGLSKYYKEKEQSLIMSLYNKGITDSKAFSFKFSTIYIDKKATFYIGKHEDFSKSETAYCSLLDSTAYEQYMWACRMSSMSLVNNNTSINANGKYSVIFDTGTNMIIMPTSYLNEIKNDLSKFGCTIYQEKSGKNTVYQLKCEGKPPEFQFTIDNNVFKIPFEYSYYKIGVYFYSRVIFQESTVYIFGSPFFFTFHTMFNYDDNKLYFYPEDPNNLIKGSSIGFGVIVLILISIIIAVVIIVCLVKWIISKRKKQEVVDIPSSDYFL